MSTGQSDAQAVAGPTRAPSVVADGSDPLFQPLTVAGLTLRNRIVMAPMGTGLDDAGRMNDAAIAYYRRRAEGGTGTITVEALMVDPETRGPEPKIYGPEFVPGLRTLVEQVHAAGAVVGAQLLHPGRQVLSGRHVGPSAVAINAGLPVPHALTVSEIDAIVEQYADAAERAVEAGFDFVEVHGAHGYLPSDFLSQLANQRDDGYGGSLAARARFSREIAQAIRRRCPGVPFFWRLSAEDALPGGTTIEHGEQMARWLEQDGVDCLSVSAGNWRSLEVTIAPMWAPSGHMARLASRVRACVSVPVIAVGRLNDPEGARRLVREGHADLIAIGRGLIADPDWAGKVAAGHSDDVRPCIACNACVDLVGPGGEIRCAVNPAVGRDHEWSLRPADPARRVAVVGSGPSGLAAARIARERGHAVTLYERDARVGGKIVAAGSAPSKREVLRFRDYEERTMARLGVDVRLSTAVTAADLAASDADAIVVAVGADALTPPIPGLDAPHVRDAQEYLRGEHPVPAGARVAVIGGSATGCETAELLVSQGAVVTVIEMAPRVGAGIEAITRRHIVRELKRHGATMLTGAKVVEVRADAVVYESGGERHEVAAEWVALAIGWRPRGAGLVEGLPGREVHVVGDAARPADFVAAINAGADVGLAI